jgi:hypothetical protein
MQRRILVNYRMEPGALAAMLPAPFRPVLVQGYGVAVGLTSENAAHRVAVEWDTPGGPTLGVYVARRDTSSRLTTLAGGRLVPGYQHAATFRVAEGNGSYRVQVESRDGQVRIAVAAHVAKGVMDGSVFANVDEASAFFRCAPVAYAPTPTSGVFDGLELRTRGSDIRPLHVDAVASSFFADAGRFGRVELDSAFLMSGLDTAWRPMPRLVVPTS